MHRAHGQILEDLLSSLDREVIDPLKPHTNLLSVCQHLLFDIVKNDGQAGPDLLELLDIDVLVMIKCNAIC